jgi:hypothetical protein
VPWTVRVLCRDSSTEVHLDPTVEPLHLSYSVKYKLILLKATNTYLLQKEKHIWQHKHADVTTEYCTLSCSRHDVFWSLNDTHQVAKLKYNTKTIKLQKRTVHRHFKGMSCHYAHGQRVNQAGNWFLAWLSFPPWRHRE